MSKHNAAFDSQAPAGPRPDPRREPDPHAELREATHEYSRTVSAELALFAQGARALTDGARALKRTASDRNFRAVRPSKPPAGDPPTRR